MSEKTVAFDANDGSMWGFPASVVARWRADVLQKAESVSVSLFDDDQLNQPTPWQARFDETMQDERLLLEATGQMEF